MFVQTAKFVIGQVAAAVMTGISSGPMPSWLHIVMAVLGTKINEGVKKMNEQIEDKYVEYSATCRCST